MLHYVSSLLSFLQFALWLQGVVTPDLLCGCFSMFFLFAATVPNKALWKMFIAFCLLILKGSRSMRSAFSFLFVSLVVICMYLVILFGCLNILRSFHWFPLFRFLSFLSNKEIVLENIILVLILGVIVDYFWIIVWIRLDNLHDTKFVLWDIKTFHCITEWSYSSLTSLNDVIHIVHFVRFILFVETLHGKCVFHLKQP